MGKWYCGGWLMCQNLGGQLPARPTHLLRPWKNDKQQHNCIQLIFLMMKKMNWSHYYTKCNPSKKSQKGKIIKFKNNNHIILRFLIHAKNIKCYTNVLPYVSTMLSQGRLLLFRCTVLKTIQNKRVPAGIATHFLAHSF